MKTFYDEDAQKFLVTSDDGRWSSWARPEPPNGGWGCWEYDPPWEGNWRVRSHGPNVNVGSGTVCANLPSAKARAISFVKGNEEFDKRNRKACQKCKVMCYGRSLEPYEWLCSYCHVEVYVNMNTTA